MIAEKVVEKNGKKRVLLCLHLPPPVHGASMVGKYIQDSALINNRFDCQYVNITAAASLSDIGRWGIKKFWRYCKLLHRLHHEINLFQPHLVYLTPNSAGRPFYKDFMTVVLLKFWCRRLREKQNTQILLHFHNKGCEDFSKCWINDWLYKRFFNNIHVLLLSKRLYDDVKRYVPEQRVVVCGNGIPDIITPNNKSASDGVQKAHSFSAPIHILFLSNMIRSKGVSELIEACRILKDRGAMFRCRLVGALSADYPGDSLAAEIRAKGLEDIVTYEGPRYGEEKWRAFSEADLFAFPSHYPDECFPLVVLEAMGAGLPVVTTDEGAIPEMVRDGEDGVICPKKDPAALADTLGSLLADPLLRTRMGESGKHRYQSSYTLECFERNIVEILNRSVDA